MTDAPLAFIDTETTGLHPDTHTPWEIAISATRRKARTFTTSTGTIRTIRLRT